jgi:hypothetical protein
VAWAWGSAGSRGNGPHKECWAGKKEKGGAGRAESASGPGLRVFLGCCSAAGLRWEARASLALGRVAGLLSARMWQLGRRVSRAGFGPNE